MAGSWLDALLGAVFNSSSSVPIAGGLNFSGGVKAVLNRVTGRVDVSLTNPPRAPGTSDAFDPTVDDSDVVEVLPDGHDAGFYLVGAQCSYAGSEAVSAPSFTISWASDALSFTREVEGEDVSGSQSGWHMPPALVYSDGSAPLTAQFLSGVTTGSLTATFRATALRVSG